MFPLSTLIVVLVLSSLFGALVAYIAIQHNRKIEKEKLKNNPESFENKLKLSSAPILISQWVKDAISTSGIINTHFSGIWPANYRTIENVLSVEETELEFQFLDDKTTVCRIWLTHHINLYIEISILGYGTLSLMSAANDVLNGCFDGSELNVNLDSSSTSKIDFEATLGDKVTATDLAILVTTLFENAILSIGDKCGRPNEFTRNLFFKAIPNLHLNASIVDDFTVALSDVPAKEMFFLMNDIQRHFNEREKELNTNDVFKLHIDYDDLNSRVPYKFFLNGVLFGQIARYPDGLRTCYWENTIIENASPFIMSDLLTEFFNELLYQYGIEEKIKKLSNVEARDNSPIPKNAVEAFNVKASYSTQYSTPVASSDSGLHIASYGMLYALDDSLDTQSSKSVSCSNDYSSSSSDSGSSCSD